MGSGDREPEGTEFNTFRCLICGDGGFESERSVKFHIKNKRDSDHDEYTTFNQMEGLIEGEPSMTDKNNNKEDETKEEEKVTTDNNDTDNPLKNMPEDETDEDDCPDCGSSMRKGDETQLVSGQADTGDTVKSIEFVADADDRICPKCGVVVMEDGTVVR